MTLFEFLIVYCPECGKRFPRKKGLNAHIAQMHKRNHVDSHPVVESGPENKQNTVMAKEKEKGTPGKTTINSPGMRGFACK